MSAKARVISGSVVGIIGIAMVAATVYFFGASYWGLLFGVLLIELGFFFPYDVINSR